MKGEWTVHDSISPSYEATSQVRYRCRLEWGRYGAQLAAARDDVLVVVDTLRFSTAVTAAVHHGVVIYPCAPGEEASMAAQYPGVAIGSSDRLSPAGYSDVEPGTGIILPSLNGAACSRYGRLLRPLLVGALVNATAVAGAAESAVRASTRGVTVLACGERRSSHTDGTVRFALEDYLGAGAILSGINLDKSPEAKVCESAFLGSRAWLEESLWNCVSGWELRAKGLGGDVRLAATLDRYDTVPVMSDDHLIAWGDEGRT